jgi:chromate reductase
MPLSIGYIIGSTSASSINRKFARGLGDLARSAGSTAEEALDLAEIPIAGLPLYDHDLDGDFPPAAVELKRAIRSSDAVLIVTPEYNRSIPGALKNAIDWASRPYGDNAFQRKPVGIVGASVAAAGTAMAQQHLRNILAYLDAPTLGQPEVFIQYTAERFAEDGTIIDASTRKFLAGWLARFGEWARLLAPRAAPTQASARG